MGVFQRKVDQSVTSPLRTNVKRRSGVDRRRFTHPSSEISGLDTEKWPPTLTPGPEVVEADLDDTKASVKAREFSAWTPDSLPGRGDGSEFIVSAPNLTTPSRPLSQGSKPLPAKRPPVPQKPGVPQKPSLPVYRPVLPKQGNPLGIVLSDPGIPTVPPPKPRLRSAKDPYAKRKAKFEQKPKLAPITETDSRRSSQTSASSGNRNSGDVHPVILVPEPEKDVDTMADQAPIMESDYDDDVDGAENEEDLNTNGHNMETSTIPFEQMSTMTSSTTSTTADPTDDNGYVSYNDITQDSGILPFRGPAASPFSSTENLREDPSLSKSEPDAEDDKKSIYENVILRRDGSVESLIDPGKNQRPPKPKPLGPPLPERDFNAQTDMDTYANFRIDVQNIDNKKKSVFDISDTETKDTGVGPDPSDNLGGLENNAFQYDEDFQLEIESVTDLLDEVVFGKGRSTQTGDSLRLGNDRTNLVIQKINMINERQQQAQQSRPRPISDCAVVDSGTSMDDLDPDPLPLPVSTKVVMRHQQQPEPQQYHRGEGKVDIEQSHLNYAPASMGQIRDSIRTIEPPPLMPEKVDMRIGSNTAESIVSSLSDDVPKRRNGKMCIGMSVIFTVIILGIIAAGVIVYFVVQQMDSGGKGDQSIKAYYLGIKLGHQPYTFDLEDVQSDKYKVVAADICTYVQEAMTNTGLFKNVYKHCAIMDFRMEGMGIAAHVKIVFLKEKIEQIQENDASDVIGTIEFYLKEYLRVGSGSNTNSFRSTYGPSIEDIMVVQFWNQLSEFGTKPGS